MRGLLSLVSLLALAGTASAQTASVSIQPGAGFDELANAAELSFAELERQLEGEVAALYGLLNVEKFLQLSANAQNLVSVGNAADYASNPDGFFLGVGVSTALSVSEEDLQSADFDAEREMPVSGGAMLSILAGSNLRGMGLPALTVSVHGMYIPDLEVSQLNGSFLNAGIRLQLQVIRPTNDAGFNPFTWGGLALTTGYTYARTTLTLKDQYRADTPITGGYVLDTLSAGTLELVQTAHTIPIELTTNLTFFELLTIYGGGALDIPFGEATARFDLSSDLSTNVNGQRLDVGTASLQVDGGVKADDVLARFLLGVQLNVWKLRIFAQANYQPAASALGGTAGLKIMF